MTARLSIDVEARMASVLDGIDTLKRKSEGMARSVESSFGVLKASVAGVVAAFSLGAISSEIQRLIGDMSALDDAAEKTGSSVEDLSETFNNWRVGGGSLDELTGAVGRLTRSMQSADEETKGAGEAFDRLGIQTRDANGNLRPAVQVLNEIAQKLNEYEDSTNKTAIAQAIFGKAGSDLLPKLKDLATEQGNLGRITAEQAAAAEELEKAWRRLTIEADLVKQNLLSGIIPTITNLIQQFRDGKEAAGGFWAAMFRYGTASTDPSKELERIRGRVADLNNQLENEQPALGFFGRGARSRGESNRAAIEAELAQLAKDQVYFRKLFDQQAGTRFDDPALPGLPKQAAPALTGGGKKVGSEASKRAADWEDAESRINKALEGIAADIKKIDELPAIIARLDEWFFLGAINAEQYEAAVNKLFKTTSTQGKDAQSEIARQQAEVKKLSDAWRDAIDPTRRYFQQLEEIAKLEQQAGGLSAGEAGLARTKVFDDMQKALTETEKAAKTTDDIAQQLGLTFTSAFEDAVIQGRGFRGVLRGIIDDISRLVLRESVTKPGATWIAALLRGAMGGSSDASAFSFLGGTLAGERASGGPVDGGRPYLVGEKGAEIIVPNSAGRVIPNHALGGVTVNQTVTISAGVTASEVARAMQTAKNEAIAAIRQNFRSNGDLARAG